MNLLLSITFASFIIADCFTKPLPPTAYQSLLAIGDNPTSTPTTPAIQAAVATAPTVDIAPTVVASATTASASDSVPLLHPNLDPAAPTLPIVLDTGASIPIALPALDYLPVTQAPFRLIRSATSVVSKVTSTPVAPYTLITGEDIIDLSSPDPTNSDLDSCFALLSVSELVSHLQSNRRFHSEVFGTANLIFVYSGFNTLIHLWVEPIEVDWLDWIPLPRLILSESYFHIFGLDYLQAFALLHLLPIWIYSLVHFGLE